MSLIVSAIGQGLLWALLGVGLYISFRILNFADMSVEGTFPMGAAVSVAAITHGMSPVFSIVLAFGAGLIAGMVTGLLYTKGHIPSLLAGILVMTAAYSVNLRIMGKSNISLLGKQTIFSNSFLQNLPKYFDSVTVGFIVIAIITILLVLFLQTDFGQAFIATGDNPNMAKSMGIHTDSMTIFGLMLSNGLVSVSGALVAQNNGYSDVNMGIGIIVAAMAAIIIGEVIFGDLTLNQRLVAVTLGSIIYRLIILAVLTMGFSANDLNLTSSIVLTLFMVLPSLEKRFRIRKTLVKGMKKDE